MVTAQVKLPLQAPLQPVNTPPPGLAGRVTTVPMATVVVQEPPQLILPLAPLTGAIADPRYGDRWDSNVRGGHFGT